MMKKMTGQECRDIISVSRGTKDLSSSILLGFRGWSRLVLILLRCVRALARDPAGVCIAPAADSKCERCFPGGRLCEDDPHPLHHQQTINRAAAARADVRPALRAWEGMLTAT